MSAVISFCRLMIGRSSTSSSLTAENVSTKRELYCSEVS
jgi:hypothetical protein